MQPIQDQASLDAAFDAPVFLLYKHSPICPISGGAYMEVEEFEEDHPDVPVGFIDVVEDRQLSLAVAGRTGIAHESPQALLLRNGEVVWHASQWRITLDRLVRALGTEG